MRIYAHRGASHYAPENTIAAFQKAIDYGVDCIELDVRLSQDNVPVVIHDASINRTSNGKGYVHKLTVNQLKSFDFGSSFSDDYRGEPIPTLEDVLDLVQSHSVNINIELKNGPLIPQDLELNVLKLINHYKLENRTLFSSFDHTSLDRLNTLNNQLSFGLIFHINLINLFDYIDTIPFKITSIHPNHFYVTQEMIRLANDRGLEVNAYTVNDKKTAHLYKEMGVHGLITNDPLVTKTN